MAISASALRALGCRRVTLRTREATFIGHIAQRSIPDAAVLVMFASDASPEPFAITLDDIEEVVER